MRVRKAKQGDVPSIAGVHVTAWQACYRGIMPDEFLDRLSVSDREPIWHRELGATNRLVLVARSQRKISGL
ncbi:MAG TPA: GNAT family N-acetyltransferase, partial [Candidatus Binatia bacterium]|nr:GNAT family N-acetyltransferase [Candidatus Binatia bacterium]